MVRRDIPTLIQSTQGESTHGREYARGENTHWETAEEARVGTHGRVYARGESTHGIEYARSESTHG